MPKPAFFIIGAQKCGTSWLARTLGRHPQVFMPRGEAHFFDKRYKYAKGEQWYEQRFEGAGAGMLIGEKTPEYLWANGYAGDGHLPNVHQNLYRYNPRAKLLVVLRDPVARAVSAINHLIKDGVISPFEDIDRLLTKGEYDRIRNHGLLEKGRYLEQLQAYREYFSEEQMRVYIFEEDFAPDPHQGLADVCRFLGVDPSHRFRNVERRVNGSCRSTLGLLLAYYVRMPGIRQAAKGLDRYLLRHVAPAKATIADRTRRYLEGYYREDNERLFEFLGRRIGAWETTDTAATS